MLQEYYERLLHNTVQSVFGYQFMDPLSSACGRIFKQINVISCDSKQFKYPKVIIIKCIDIIITGIHSLFSRYEIVIFVDPNAVTMGQIYAQLLSSNN